MYVYSRHLHELSTNIFLLLKIFHNYKKSNFLVCLSAQLIHDYHSQRFGIKISQRFQISLPTKYYLSHRSHHQFTCVRHTINASLIVTYTHIYNNQDCWDHKQCSTLPHCFGCWDETFDNLLRFLWWVTTSFDAKVFLDLDHNM